MVPNETNEIIKGIIKQEIQKLPNFFIDKFRQYIKTSSNKNSQMNIIHISKSLIKDKYMKLDDILNIEDLINNHKMFGNDIFDLIFIEYKNGHEISKNIIDKVKNAGKTNEHARNLIKLIEKTYTNIDILRNPRNDLEKRKNNGYGRLNCRFLIGFFLKLDLIRRLGSDAKR
ncbi:unnamed protein product [Didymodactylos carnosus]|uniref:Uncharacterized protein n=2 Tax=Didymodactylos carnosus TaxID=1234261 RepID=A0A816E568_9BILA|nr:unnamed protein product [Didymodactylos carnosus]CAF4555706.1 unnamed protein product [Didymodactylos carnosus]